MGKISGGLKVLEVNQAVHRVLPRRGQKLEQIALNANHIEAIRPSVPPKDVYIDMINGNSYKIPDADYRTVLSAYIDAMR